MKFAWSNTDSFDKADVVLVGVPDETGSYATRKGSSKAPDAIRKVSNEREVFERRGMKTVALSQICPINKNIYDYGNIAKGDVSKVIEKITSEDKIPVTVGGDHSITAEVLKGIDKVREHISVVYIDSHPDFICSSREYYGSVVCDISEYKNVDFSSSIEIGVRAPEPEELINLRRKYLKIISAIDVEAIGLKNVIEKVKDGVGENIYVSMDMDVVDPAFAPGVSSPVPAGLTSNQLLYFMTEIAKLGIIGFDVMEVCPEYDIQDMTSHLAARVIIETISCIR